MILENNHMLSICVRLSYHDHGWIVTSGIWKLNFVSLIDVK